MKPESRLDIARRNVAQAEAYVARQKCLIEELKAGRHRTTGAEIFLRNLESALATCRKTLRLLQH